MSERSTTVAGCTGPPLIGCPAPLLVIISIASVQTGAAIARTVFDEAGAMGITLMRLGISCVVLVVRAATATLALVARCAGGDAAVRARDGGR